MRTNKRKGHKIQKPKAKTIPEHVIFLDTETTQEQDVDGKTYHTLLLGVCIYARFRRDGKKDQKTVHRFNSNTAFWDIVSNYCRPKTVLYLMSHNAVFDFTVTEHIKHLTDMGYKCIFVFDNQMTFISKWSNGKHSIVILNTANWFAGSVERWGKELNLPKLEMPTDITDLEEMYIYCERDTEILYQLFCWYRDFINSHDLGSWKWTIASQAFYAFRYRFMQHPIYVPDVPGELTLARESYRGGRTECFRVGTYSDGPFYKVDVNSMYPYVMRNECYPTNLKHTGQHLTRRQLEFTLRHKAIIAKCTVKTTVPYFPFYTGERCIYPLGRFKCVLTTKEIELAYKLGFLEAIHQYAIYTARPIFVDYVDFFYAKKQEYSKPNTRLLRTFTKLYLNALYGKFGQRGYVDTPIGEVEQAGLSVSYGFNARTGEHYLVRQIGTQLLYSEKGGEGYNSFCAIASHVTANARLYLYDLVIMAGRENCFYCDTDSLIVNSDGYKRLSSLYHETNLGFLKEEERASEIQIVAPKHYRLDNHWTMKGVRKNARQVDVNVFEQEQWPGLNSILRNGKEQYYNTTVHKTLSPEIKSGTVDGLGFVLPFVLDSGTLPPRVERM